MRRLRPKTLVVIVTAVAALLTLLVSVFPVMPLAYRERGVHVGIEAAAGVIALMTSYLVFGRYRRSGRVDDLALTGSLGAFGVADLALAALPAVLTHHKSPFVTWAPLWGGLLAASLLVVAAFAPQTVVPRPRRSAVVAAAGVLLALGVVALVAALVSLPHAIDPGLSPDAAGRPRVVGNAAVLALQLVLCALFAIAAVGFMGRAERTRDPLFPWIAAGAVLASFARLNFFLFPSLYSDWVFTGDLLCFLFYVVLLVGAGREVGSYWRRVAEAATLEERRRLARELHDGLAQELAFIVMQSRGLLERGEGPPALEQIAVASTRALDEARRAIAALTRPLDEPLPRVVGQVAEEVASRVGLDLDLRVSDDVEVSPRIREELLRILREAVTNAARHGHATMVRVELADGDGLRLSVVDDGVGFDPSSAGASRRGGFGFTSMRERADALGGQLTIRSRPGSGTEVEVIVP